MGWSDLLDTIGRSARTAREAISPWKYLSATDIASFAPGGGVVNAWQDSGKGWQNLKAGNYGQAAIDYGNMGLNLAGELPPVAMAMMAGKKAAQGIRAFHGSPHDFDRFDMSKIGTGEGAQAYGHGLYFAENEAVAKGYRDTLAKQAPVSSDLDTSIIQKLLKETGGNKDAVKAELMRRESLGLSPKGRWEGLANRVDDTPYGRMYEVRINADPEHFLDWDKPLAQQNDQVKQALEPLTSQLVAKRSEIETGKTDLFRGDKWVGYLPTGKIDDLSVGQLHNIARRDGEDFLTKAGIPGIKYFDAGSRAAGDGSRNYVVFDDKLVEILKKYGWVPGMAIPAAAMMEYAGPPSDGPRM